MALPSDSQPSPTDKQAERRKAEQDVLLREIDEAVREDDMAQFARRYGKPLAGLVVAGLLAFGGYLFWQDRNRTDLETGSEEFVRALDHVGAGNLDAANKSLAPIATDGSQGAAISAKLLQAGLALQQDRKTEALALYKQVAADGSAPQPYRDLAKIRAVALDFDSLKPDVVVAELKNLAVPGNPWFGSAGELVAMAYLKEGKKDLAGPLFAEISKSKDAPETLKSRTRQMAGLLGVDAVEEPEALVTKVEDAQPPATE